MPALLLTGVEGKVVDEALPGDEGDLLDAGRGAAEAQLLQVQQGVDEGAAPVEVLSGKHGTSDTEIDGLWKRPCWAASVSNVKEKGTTFYDVCMLLF